MMVSIDERLEKAVTFFAERAARTEVPQQRELYEHLRGLAEVNQLNTRMLEVINRQIDEMRHALGVH